MPEPERGAGAAHPEPMPEPNPGPGPEQGAGAGAAVVLSAEYVGRAPHRCPGPELGGCGRKLCGRGNFDHFERDSTGSASRFGRGIRLAVPVRGSSSGRTRDSALILERPELEETYLRMMNED